MPWGTRNGTSLLGKSCWYSLHTEGRECRENMPTKQSRLSFKREWSARTQPLHGAEYESYPPAPLGHLAYHNVPCAVCYVPTRAAIIMIPAKTQCHLVDCRVCRVSHDRTLQPRSFSVLLCRQRCSEHSRWSW